MLSMEAAVPSGERAVSSNERNAWTGPGAGANSNQKNTLAGFKTFLARRQNGAARP
jgi:hypothetical protein